MRVKTIGAMDSGALPSSKATLGAINGEPGGWTSVVMTTALRSLLIAPGVWLGGARGWRLVAGSLVASTSISVFLYLWHVMHPPGEATAPGTPPAVPAPEPIVTGDPTGQTISGTGSLRRLRRM